MRRRRGWARVRKQEEEPEVNLTPLIDVVFVILIMFIVIAPLLELDEVKLAEGPHTGTHSVSDQSPITIRVKEDNSVFLNNQLITLQALTEYLVLAKRQHPLVTPQLLHDRKAQFGTYQAIKNALENAGFAEMDVILSPSNTA